MHSQYKRSYKTKYSKAEKEYILDNYGIIPTEQIAKTLGRSPKAIHLFCDEHAPRLKSLCGDPEWIRPFAEVNERARNGGAGTYGKQTALERV